MQGIGRRLDQAPRSPTAACPAPLHAARAGVGALWAAALSAAALVLFASARARLLAVVLALAAPACGRRDARSRARCAWRAIVSLPIVLVNVLVSREGLTVFARLGDLGPFGQGDLTVEALVYGAVIALKVHVRDALRHAREPRVDPDELLRIAARGFRFARR